MDPDELLVAMNLYRKLTFGQLHARNPVIIEVADKLHRPPGSLAMKLCNLALLDPTLKARGIRGLPGASSLDHEVWAEFNADAATLGPQSEETFRSLFGAHETDEGGRCHRRGVRVQHARELKVPAGPTEQSAQVKVRRASSSSAR